MSHFLGQILVCVYTIRFMVKLQSFAQLSGSALVRFLCQIAVFAYEVIGCFISSSSHYYNHVTSCELLKPVPPEVFKWSHSDSKSLPVCRTLLSILADLNNAVVWIVSIHPLISNSFSPLSKPLETVPSAPNTIGVPVTFMSHSFLCSLGRSK